MANKLAIGFQIQLYSDGSTGGLSFDLRTAPVCFFYPQAPGFSPEFAPLVSEKFDITKLTPTDFVLGRIDSATYEGQSYSYFTQTSNSASSGWTLSDYTMTLNTTWGTSGAINQIVGMLLF